MPWESRALALSRPFPWPYFIQNQRLDTIFGLAHLLSFPNTEIIFLGGNAGILSHPEKGQECIRKHCS